MIKNFYAPPQASPILGPGPSSSSASPAHAPRAQPSQARPSPRKRKLQPRSDPFVLDSSDDEPLAAATASARPPLPQPTHAPSPPVAAYSGEHAPMEVDSDARLSSDQPVSPVISNSSLLLSPRPWKGKGREIVDSEAPVSPKEESVPSDADSVADLPQLGQSASHDGGHATDPVVRSRRSTQYQGSFAPVKKRRTRTAAKSSGVRPAAAPGAPAVEPEESVPVEWITVPPFVSRDHEVTDEQKVAFYRRQASLLPSERMIVGPVFRGEFDEDLHTYILHYEEAQKLINTDNPNPENRVDRSAYTLQFQRMVTEADQAELHKPGQLRICPRDGDVVNRSPPFEFIYTNRVVYTGNFLPVQPNGCGCIGDCADPRNLEGCACRARQTLASKSRRGGEVRAGWTGFAYDSEGM